MSDWREWLPKMMANDVLAPEDLARYRSHCEEREGAWCTLRLLSEIDRLREALSQIRHEAERAQYRPGITQAEMMCALYDSRLLISRLAKKALGVESEGLPDDDPRQPPEVTAACSDPAVHSPRDP